MVLNFLNCFFMKCSYSAIVRKVLPEDEWTTAQEGAEKPEVPGQYLVQVLDQKGRGIPDMERVVDCSLLRY